MMHSEQPRQTREEVESSVESLAAHYVDVISARPNAWGQHLSPFYGQSHYIMNAGTRLFGTDATQEAIKAEFQRRKEGESA